VGAIVVRAGLFAYVRCRRIDTVVKGMKIATTAPRNPYGSTASPDVAASPTAVLLSVKDVCMALRCGRTFVYTLLQHGELRAVKLGRLTRITRAALEEFVAQKAAYATDDFRDRWSYGADREALRARAHGRARERTAKVPSGSARTVGTAEQQWLMDAVTSTPAPATSSRANSRRS
jgi:excisionase family DNA binding protein